MNTKTLTGWLLIVGPVLTFIVIGLLYTQLIGDQETPATSVNEMMAKPELARLLLGIGSIVFVAIFLGLGLLARSMQGDDKSGSAYATIAATLFGAIAAVGIAATGLSAAALEASETSVAAAVNLEAVSQAMFTGLWFFWGIASLLLGASMIMQKNLHVAIAWIITVFGVYVIVSSLVDLNLGDAADFVVWIVMTLVVAAAGVLTLREQRS